MKVVFLQEVPGGGLPGEVKEVREGYARNYLLPKKLAIPATPQALRKAERLAEEERRRQENLDAAARTVAEVLDGQTLTFTARVGEAGRLFGSITAGDIAEEASRLAGAEVDRHRVHLGEPIKELGSREVPIRLTRNVQVRVQIEVVPETGQRLSTVAKEPVAESQEAPEPAEVPGGQEAEAAAGDATADEEG